MRQHFYKLALIVVLGSGFAVAQSMPQQQPSSPQPSTSSPSSTDQQPSSAPADQNKSLPNTDQNTTDQNKDNQGAQKMPQSDAAPAAATGDVQNSIQSAIQKDPTLSSSNITVDVKGKTVELSGTVPSKDAKDSAERIAKENANGMKVKSHLKVASASDATQPKANK